MGKVKTKFVYILALVSIIGFLATAIEGFLGVNVGTYTAPLIFIVIGIGLVIEGGIRNVIKMLKNGLSSDETTHILAVVIGVMAIITGILSLPDINIGGAVFLAFKGILSVFAIIIIIIETWLVR